MKLGEKSQRKSTSSPSGGTDGPITAENYVERARAFIKAKGEDGEGFVIRAYLGEKGALETKEPATPAQWSAWMAYFEAKGIFAKKMMVKGKLTLVNHPFHTRHGLSTVPAEWPHQFDGLWVIDTPSPLEPPRPEPYVPDWRKEQLLEMLRTAAGLDAPQGRRRGPDVRDAQGLTGDERLGALRASYAAQPATMSPELAESLKRTVPDAC